MSNDLISREALLEALWEAEKECEDAMLIPSFSTAIHEIRNQPTAYDIDKVVEQLEEMSVNYCKEYGYAEDENVLYLPDVIEIVKGGAMDE